MLKKILYVTLFFLISCLTFAICYLVGVFLNWDVLTVIYLWLAILLISIILNFFINLLLSLLKNKAHKKIIQKLYQSQKRTNIGTILKNGIEIVNSGRFKRASVPWFFVVGKQIEHRSLLAGVSLPLLQFSGKANYNIPVRTLRWWFYGRAGYLEISDTILHDKSLIRNIATYFSGWFHTTPSPSGLIISLPITEFQSKKNLQEIAQQYLIAIEQLSSAVKSKLPVYLIVSGCETLGGFNSWVHNTRTLKNDHTIGFLLSFPSFQLKKDNFSSDISNKFNLLKNELDQHRLYALKNIHDNKERYDVFSLPENIYSFKENIEFFLSAFRNPSAYFAEHNISGVFFVNNDTTKKQNKNLLDDVLFYSIPVARRNYKKNTSVFRKNVLALYFFLLFVFGFFILASYNVTHLITTKDNESEVELIEKLSEINDAIDFNYLSYIFLPVLNMHKNNIHDKIKDVISFDVRSLSDIESTYKILFDMADLSEKRDLILSLARTILKWDEMVEKNNITTWTDEYEIPELIRFTQVPSNVSAPSSLIIEKSALKGREGRKRIQTMRRVLTDLIESDISYKWLLAPIEAIPDISVDDFWPDANSDVTLPGIWTREGQESIDTWIQLIIDALGNNRETVSISTFRTNLKTIRQNEWYEFLLLAAKENKYKDKLKTPTELIDIISGRSPEDLFLKTIDHELNNIPNAYAQSWLVTFRQLMPLLSYGDSESFNTLVHRSEWFARLRVLNAIGGKLINVNNEKILHWKRWKTSTQDVVNEALDSNSSTDFLTRGLFQVYKSENQQNPLVNMNNHFQILKGGFLRGNKDRLLNAIFDIYNQQTHALLRNAYMKSGEWINNQWQNSVLLPLSSIPDEDYSDKEYRANKLITNFLKGPAKEFIVLTPEGIKPSSFNNESFPFSHQFISFINHIMDPDDTLFLHHSDDAKNQDALLAIQHRINILNAELSKLESQTHPLILSSRPATITGGGRVNPIGSLLKLQCMSGNHVLDSMNFADSANFIWSPGQCHQVSIKIKFPDFSVIYSLSGDSSWPDFLKSLDNGEIELPVSVFPAESMETLKILGIKTILVRYSTTDISPLIQSYNRWNTLKMELDDLTDKYNSYMQKKIGVNKIRKHEWLSKIPKNIVDIYSAGEGMR